MFHKFCKGWMPQWSLSKMLEDALMWKLVVALIATQAIVYIGIRFSITKLWIFIKNNAWMDVYSAFMTLVPKFSFGTSIRSNFLLWTLRPLSQMFQKFCKGWLPQWFLSKMFDDVLMWKLVCCLNCYSSNCFYWCPLFY